MLLELSAAITQSVRVSDGDDRAWQSGTVMEIGMGSGSRTVQPSGHGRRASFWGTVQRLGDSPQISQSGRVICFKIAGSQRVNIRYICHIQVLFWPYLLHILYIFWPISFNIFWYSGNTQSKCWPYFVFLMPYLCKIKALFGQFLDYVSLYSGHIIVLFWSYPRNMLNLW